MWNFFGDECYEVKKNQDNILKEEGYPWEEYTVTTEDGYINSIYRIPYSNKTKTNNNERRPPVILGHGMTCSSAMFLNQSRLGYYLADEGFDVWLPNNRGSTFSRKHVSLDPKKDKAKYWNFSWHEIGVYDLAAFIDFVIGKTGFKKVYYVGHSQGTTAYAVLASERPEYNDKILLSCFLGSAIATDTGISSKSLNFLLYFLGPVYTYFDRYICRLYECPFINTGRVLLSLSKPNSFARALSLWFIFAYSGHDNYEQASEFDCEKFGLTSPNSSSIRQKFHYRQIFQAKRFQQYDHGPEKNLEKYGSTKPPLYDLSRVTSPVAIFYGKNDMYNMYKKDKLDEKMANVVYVHIVEDDNFNHIDFLIAKDSIPLVYEPMVELMRQYPAK